MKFSPRSSLALWRRKERYRQRKLDYYHLKNDVAGINKWDKLHKEAVHMVHKREAEVNPLRVRAFLVAVSQVGVVEVGGNNRGKDVERIIRANGGIPGEAWCGDFVAYDYLKAGAKSVTRAWASVNFLEKLLSRTSSPKRGDVVIYNFGHTGLFDRWDHNGYFFTVEGNTGDVGARSDSLNGKDGVKRKRRHVSQVSSFRKVLR